MKNGGRSPDRVPALIGPITSLQVPGWIADASARNAEASSHLVPGFPFPAHGFPMHRGTLVVDNTPGAWIVDAFGRRGAFWV